MVFRRTSSTTQQSATKQTPLIGRHQDQDTAKRHREEILSDATAQSSRLRPGVTFTVIHELEGADRGEVLCEILAFLNEFEDAGAVVGLHLAEKQGSNEDEFTFVKN